MQTELAFDLSQEHLQTFLSKAAGMPVNLVITENTARMASLKVKDGEANLRLHRIFLGAGPGVLSELAAFVKRRGGRTPAIREFINRNSQSHLPRPRARRLSQEGKHHDLKSAFDRVNAAYFGGGLECAITWGKVTGRRRVKRRTLGSYCYRTKVITVNPALDRREVPAYYLDYIVYHEMLHALLGVKEVNGRRYAHTREFREAERRFADFERARSWESGGKA